MSRKSEAKDLHGQIRKILHEEWDPIGVCGIDEAQDEYDAYVASLYRLLIRRIGESEVFDYLWWAETEHMGLVGDRQRTAAIAKRLAGLVNEA